MRHLEKILEIAQQEASAAATFEDFGPQDAPSSLAQGKEAAGKPPKAARSKGAQPPRGVPSEDSSSIDGTNLSTELQCRLNIANEEISLLRAHTQTLLDENKKLSATVANVERERGLMSASHRSEIEMIRRLYEEKTGLLTQTIDELRESLSQQSVDRRLTDMKSLCDTLVISLQSELNAKKSELLEMRTRFDTMERSMSSNRNEYATVVDALKRVEDSVSPLVKHFRGTAEEKGSSGEEAIRNFISDEARYQDGRIIDTSGQGYAGDALFLWKSLRCLIEIKNKLTITADDIKKFERDIETCSTHGRINCALFISMQTSKLPDKTRQPIQVYIVGNVPTVYVYAPYPYATLHYAFAFLEHMISVSATQNEKEILLLNNFRAREKDVDDVLKLCDMSSKRLRLVETSLSAIANTMNNAREFIVGDKKKLLLTNANDTQQPVYASTPMHAGAHAYSLDDADDMLTSKFKNENPPKTIIAQKERKTSDGHLEKSNDEEKIIDLAALIAEEDANTSLSDAASAVAETKKDADCTSLSHDELEIFTRSEHVQPSDSEMFFNKLYLYYFSLLKNKIEVDEATFRRLRVDEVVLKKIGFSSFNAFVFAVTQRYFRELFTDAAVSTILASCVESGFTPKRDVYSAAFGAKALTIVARLIKNRGRQVVHALDAYLFTLPQYKSTIVDAGIRLTEVGCRKK